MYWYAHVFIAFHWGVEVEVLYIKGTESCSWCEDYAIDEDFGGDHACGFGGDIVGIVYLISSDGEVDSSGVIFSWAIGNNQPEIGGFPSCGYIRYFDEMDRIGSGCAFVALC